MCKNSGSLFSDAGFLLLILLLTLTGQTDAFSVNTRAKAATLSSADPISFKWSMRERFGAKDKNGLVDYHWKGETQKYDDIYVNPTSWTVDFDGCAALPPQSVLRWEIDGQALSETKCSFSHEFSALKTYVVKLSATTPDGQTSTAEASVALKDLFIVSIGDSFASGQGNPDKPRHNLHRARWIYEPCHRSALAGPAQAAMTIEQSDPHSSVTFISFACTGAVIPNLLTSSQTQGSRTMPPQLDKVFEAAGTRTIDALLVSIGGNDVHFSTLVINAIRLKHAETDIASNKLAHDGLVLLPGLFAAMAKRLSAPTNRATVANVFITQYPDLVRDETRDLCDHSTPFTELLNGISGAESEWALNAVINPLNSVIKTQATTWGWNYVDGIFSKFGGDSTDHVAHGFCAGDKRWVNTFNDSWRVQGDKNGTVHPNSKGQAWYRQRLVEELRTKGVTAPATP